MHDHNHTIDYGAFGNPHSHDIHENRRYHWPDPNLDHLEGRIAELRAQIAELLGSSVSPLRQKLQQQEGTDHPQLSNATVTPEPAKPSASTPANPAFARILRIDTRPPRIGLRYLGD